MQKSQLPIEMPSKLEVLSKKIAHSFEWAIF